MKNYIYYVPVILALSFAIFGLTYTPSNPDFKDKFDLLSAVAAFVFISIALYIYLIPAIIAHERNSKHKHLAFIINLLLGWSLIALGIALSLALQKEKTQKQY